jgi:hypothetical protein
VLPAAANWRYLGADTARLSRRLYGSNPFLESPTIAEHIRRTSDPDERVYVVGSEPQIFFHARRRSATRYIYFYPLLGGFDDGLERQREAMREVEASNPRYVVWVNVSTSLRFDPAADPYVLDASDELIGRSYRLELLAVAAGREREFRYLYGDEARRAQAALRERQRRVPWLAVYRRR